MTLTVILYAAMFLGVALLAWSVWAMVSGWMFGEDEP